ncbi:CHAT domain-containing protein [Streptomyces collinus]|uniref:CHAT domain-containing protein n=1 Tax=Streptomyces collinus TaxID=42684 RepID=UPI0036E4F9E4
MGLARRVAWSRLLTVTEGGALGYPAQSIATLPVRPSCSSGRRDGRRTALRSTRTSARMGAGPRLVLTGGSAPAEFSSPCGPRPAPGPGLASPPAPEPLGKPANGQSRLCGVAPRPGSRCAGAAREHRHRHQDAPLIHTQYETDSALAWAADRPTANLSKEQATWAAVLERLGTADWLHYAGHVEPPTGKPGTGGLLPYDHAAKGAITLGDLVPAGTVRRHWLAYLSACSTARGLPELIDQAAHIAGVLQAAGFAHVIATHWPVRSDIAADIADDF